MGAEPCGTGVRQIACRGPCTRQLALVQALARGMVPQALEAKEIGSGHGASDRRITEVQLVSEGKQPYLSCVRPTGRQPHPPIPLPPSQKPKLRQRLPETPGA